MGARDALRQMRRDLHADRAVPALYIAQPGATPQPCTVRVLDYPNVVMVPPRSGMHGAAEIQNLSPQLVFLADDKPAMLRVGAVVSIEAGEAYRIATVKPPHDNRTIAEVTRLTADEATGLPLPA